MANHVVGGFEGAVFNQSVKVLDGASYLYVFSDGVYEFLQANGHRWQYKDFINYLGRLHMESHRDFDRLLSAIKGHNPADVFEDDFTMLKVAFS
jgi:sigma-B regulation protein RsbU (phosphoserine phosphatase)